MSRQAQAETLAPMATPTADRGGKTPAEGVSAAKSIKSFNFSNFYSDMKQHPQTHPQPFGVTSIKTSLPPLPSALERRVKATSDSGRRIECAW
jgi:hypothetical protein